MDVRRLVDAFVYLIFSTAFDKMNHCALHLVLVERSVPLRSPSVVKTGSLYAHRALNEGQCCQG